jgi:hypothetical protein
MIIPKIDYRHNITLFKKNSFIIMNVTKNIASIYQTFNILAVGLVDFLKVFLQCPPNIKEVEKRRGRLWRNSTIQPPGAGRIFDICWSKEMLFN